jgi:hypothetical protein
LIYYGTKEPVGDGEVEDDIAPRSIRRLRLAQPAANLLVQLGFGEVSLGVRHFLREPLPSRLVNRVDVEFRGGFSDEAFQHVVKMVAPALGSSIRQVRAN